MFSSLECNSLSDRCMVLFSATIKSQADIHVSVVGYQAHLQLLERGVPYCRQSLLRTLNP